MINSAQVANYLNEIAQNQRKLEYCRQILAQNVSFTPHHVFNINSQQTITTLSKRQFIQIIKIIGTGNNQTQIQHIYAYFQIDAKNYITLEDFTNIILPKTNQSLKNTVINRKVNSKNLEYSLKYCLQKLFAQIIENKVRIEHFCKLKFDKNKNKKMKNSKIDLLNIKTFLAAHGSFPNQSVLETILKEMILNKGADRHNKLICEYIIDYNESKTNIDPSHQHKHQIQVTPLQVKHKMISQSQNRNKQHSSFNLQRRDKTLQDISKEVVNNLGINDSNIKIKNQSNGCVEDRIKTLMDSINIKGYTQETSRKVAFSTTRIDHIPNSFDQKQNTKSIISKAKKFKPEKQFIQNQIPSIKQPAKRFLVTTKQNSYLKGKLNETSKLISQQKIEQTDKNAIRPTRRTITFSDKANQNQRSLIHNSQISLRNQTTKRLEYLKSLVGQNSNDVHPKQISTYRY